MSEPMGMHIDIGGELPASLIEEFLKTANDEIGERLDGPDTETELRTIISAPNTIRWSGISNYGMCNELTAFCREHNLSYVHHSEASGEYDAGIYYWVPGMKGQGYVQSDSSENIMVNAEQVRPLMDLLLALLKNGEKALPLFMNNEHLGKIVQKGLKNYKKMLAELPKTINKMLPVAPILPPLTIKEDA
jgi:hypothetical protein